jgi:hypothetical protein
MSMTPKRMSIFGMAMTAAIAWPAISQPQPAASQAKTALAKMKDCLLIEDGYKERLDCYDAILAPQPRPGAKKGRTVSECRYLKEEDERLSCYNGFIAPQKKPPPAAKPARAAKKMPPIH